MFRLFFEDFSLHISGFQCIFTTYFGVFSAHSRMHILRFLAHIFEGPTSDLLFFPRVSLPQVSHRHIFDLRQTRLEIEASPGGLFLVTLGLLKFQFICLLKKTSANPARSHSKKNSPESTADPDPTLIPIRKI